MALDGFSDPVFDAIRSHLTTNWTATPIQWPNEEWESSNSEAWVKVDIHGSFYGQESIGADQQSDNRWDEEGTLWLYLAVSRGDIDFSKASGAAKALSNLFRGKTMLNGSLEFLDSTIGVARYGDEIGAWFIVPVSIDWRRIDA